MSAPTFRRLLIEALHLIEQLHRDGITLNFPLQQLLQLVHGIGGESIGLINVRSLGDIKQKRKSRMKRKREESDLSPKQIAIFLQFRQFLLTSTGEAQQKYLDTPDMKQLRTTLSKYVKLQKKYPIKQLRNKLQTFKVEQGNYSFHCYFQFNKKTLTTEIKNKATE